MVPLLVMVLGTSFGQCCANSPENLGPLQTVWLRSQNCWGEGHQIQAGKYAGLWRVHKKWQAEAPPPSYDHSGLIATLNMKRAARGLRPVVYDANAAADAAANNTEQSRHRSVGHFYNRGYAQVAALTGSFWEQWDASPAHSSILYDPNITSAGGHFNGYAATINVSKAVVLANNYYAVYGQ